MNIIKRLFSFGRVPLDSPTKSQILDYGPTVSGVRVTEDSALNFAGVWACTKIISESLACLPWHVIERGEAWRKVIDHPVSHILNVMANPEVSACAWRESAERDCLLWGNHYSEIERNRLGEPLALWRIDPSSVTPARDDSGRLVYEVGTSGDKTVLAASDVLHIPGPTNNGLIGLSTVQHARQAIGLGMAVEEFGAAFFGNGAKLSGIIRNKAGGLDAAGVKNLLESFNRKHQGSKNAHRVGYLDGDMDFQSMSVPPEDAQFLESRKFNILDICRWFRVPPHKLAELERSTHSNIEHQNIEFVTDTLLPWVVRFEAAVRMRLLNADDGLDTKLNPAGLLRGDSAARASYYTAMFNIGGISINEMRRLEDMEPIENGDGHYVQLNMQDVSREGQRIDTTQNALALAEIAAAYERVAVNGLKRCKTSADVAEWISGQGEAYTRIALPVARLAGCESKHAEHRQALRQYLADFVAEFSNLTPDDAGEALRGRLSQWIKSEFGADYGIPK